MGLQQRKRKRKIKEQVAKRDGFFCCYCGKKLTIETITLDHIIPQSNQGAFNVSNLTVSCTECNNKRGNQPFFEYCQQFNFSEEKLEKYQILYLSTLKIQILNVAKEEMLNAEQAVPKNLIEQARHYLNISIYIDFSMYESKLQICLYEVYQRKQIKYYFEQIIKIINNFEQKG